MDISGVIGLQLYSFILLCGGGIILGLVFDLFGIFKGAFHIKRKLFNDIFDLMFWAIAAIVVYAISFMANGGEIRFYTFLAIIAGVITYEQVLRPTFMRFVRIILYALAHAILKLSKVIRGFIKIPHMFIIGFFTLTINMFNFGRKN